MTFKSVNTKRINLIVLVLFCAILVAARCCS